LAFVDNEAARSGLVRGSSSNRHSGEIIEEIVALDIKTHVLSWYARVPSQSNLADAPSRGKAPAALKSWDEPHRVQVRFDFKPYG